MEDRGEGKGGRQKSKGRERGKEMKNGKENGGGKEARRREGETIARSKKIDGRRKQE